MGCNAIRTSHNPHMPELYDLCDEMGFLVMDEAFDEWEAPKNKWWQGHNVYPPKHEGYAKDYLEWHERDLIALVQRDRNHPCVILWSIGNEIDYPNDPYCHPLFQTMTGNNDVNKPEQERRFNKTRPNAERLISLAKTLVAIVKKQDPTRPVTLASAFPELSSQIGLYEALDVVGYNYKEALYTQHLANHPNQPIMGSENDHSFEAWQVVQTHEAISGQFLWTGIDYLGEAKGWPIHGSPAGILTMAGFEKEGYYRRKSFWSKEAMVYLVTKSLDGEAHGVHKWQYREGELIEVTVFTNQPKVSLYCNDRLIGEKERGEVPWMTWQLPYQKGTLTARSSLAEDQLHTTGCPCQFKIHKWEDGPYIQLEVYLVDDSGTWVREAENLVGIKTLENIILLGIENGDVADVTEYSACQRHAYEGRILVYLKKLVPDQCKVLLYGHGLHQQSIKI